LRTGETLRQSTSRLKVFISFAGRDRPMAIRLDDDLTARGLAPFCDTRDVGLGANVVLTINRALATSDFYVLLWSANCVDRPWVEEEWAAAYAREIHERRSFLFVVCLDETPLPPLLAVRRYLNGYENWHEVAQDLVDTWKDDLNTGTPAFPPPNPTRELGPHTLTVRVRNRAMRMTHVVGTRADATGTDLIATVTTALALPGKESQLNGALEVHFTYRLLLQDDTEVTQQPLKAQAITDGTLLDLEIHAQASGPDGPYGETTYRSERANSETPDIAALTNKAFAHLTP
jgi:TIR domain-containing protein